MLDMSPAVADVHQTGLNSLNAYPKVLPKKEFLNGVGACKEIQKAPTFSSPYLCGERPKLRLVVATLFWWSPFRRVVSTAASGISVDMLHVLLMLEWKCFSTVGLCHARMADQAFHTCTAGALQEAKGECGKGSMYSHVPRRLARPDV